MTLRIHTMPPEAEQTARAGASARRRPIAFAVSLALAVGTAPSGGWAQDAPPTAPAQPPSAQAPAASPPASPAAAPAPTSAPPAPSAAAPAPSTPQSFDAQVSAPGGPPPPVGAVNGAVPAPPANGQHFSSEQLDSILAPVALYPDQLLTQVLMASTFPLEVVEAGRWVQDPAHKALRGDALDKALVAESWDPSVKSLVPFPQVLAMLNGQLQWLQDLGTAVAEQQPDVMAAVQQLRKQAQAAGNLQSCAQQVVRTEGSSVVIQPAQSDVVYVPNYNPTIVYGAWAYPAYPPVYLGPPPGYVFDTVVATGFAFGVGVAVVGGLWGWARPDWGHRSVFVDVNRFNTINVNRFHITNTAWRAGPGSFRQLGGFHGGVAAHPGPGGFHGGAGGLHGAGARVGVARPAAARPGGFHGARPASFGGRPGGFGAGHGGFARPGVAHAGGVGGFHPGGGGHFAAPHAGGGGRGGGAPGGGSHGGGRHR